MAGLLSLNGEDCNATLGYSMTSHAGDWDSGETTRFAWSTATPLVAFRVGANPNGGLAGNAQSFVSVDAPNVQLTVMKNSEQPGRGWVVRLIETQGKATGFTLDASALQVERAHECDLVENDLRPLEVSAGKVRVSIRPYGFATVRLERGAAPGEVSGLIAKRAGDDTVALAWTPVAGASGYNIYRSDDPDAPPATNDLVARTRSASFTDRGLHIKTPYFYRVAAVSGSNLQGALSVRADAIPDGPNVTPPAPVSELGVVRRATDRLMVFWRLNTEPDVARYRVYRGGTPDFAPGEPVVTIEPARYFLQLYVDQGLSPGKTYYYKVFAEDWAGNRQKVSPVASAATPAY